MKIEIYKGIQICHDGGKDIFTTDIVINVKKMNNGKKEYLQGPRLQKLRDEIDKFLNTAAKKPVLKKVWIKDKYDTSEYHPGEVVIYNNITGAALVQSGKYSDQWVDISDRYNRGYIVVIASKENDLMVKEYNKQKKLINQINSKMNCMAGKLIPLKPEHFK